MAESSSRILVVSDFSVGDIVMNHTLFSLLKQHEPNLEIDVIAPPMARGLIRRMPEIRRHLPLDIKANRPLSYRWITASLNLRREDYRQAILIPRSTNAALLTLLSGIKIRTGYKQVHPGLVNDQRGDRPDNLHQKITGLIPRGISIPSRLPYPRLHTDAEEIAKTIARFGIDLSRSPMIILAPGAARWGAKKWPIESFVQLSQMLTEKYHVCVVGGVQELSLGQTIAAEQTTNITNLCGKLTIDEVVDVIAKAECVIANDSGLMHVAAAVRTPIVGIYGPTSPETYPPLSDSKVICWKNTLCSPCHRNRCPYGHHACMTGISPQEVFEKLSSLINTSIPNPQSL